MPAPKFWAYVRMMRVIRSRNAIEMINLMSAAFGSMDGQAAKEFTQGLQREAVATGVAGPGSGAVRPKSVEELAALMGGTNQKIVIE